MLLFLIMAVHRWSKIANCTNAGFGQSARNCGTKFSERGMIFNLEEGGIYFRLRWHLSLHRCGSEDNRLVRSFIICTLHQI